MLKSLTMLCLFMAIAHLTFAQADCPVESNNCQESSPCVEVDLSEFSMSDVNGECHVIIAVNLVQGMGGGTIKKVKLGVTNSTDLQMYCSEFELASGTLSIKDTFEFQNICAAQGDFRFTVEGYTCLNNNNCCCGRQTALSSDALPVELTSFNGRAQKNDNVLTWTTESEENTLLFSVEKSIDGRTNFQSLGEVMANGDSDIPQNYIFKDDNPLRTNYYRLMALDNDGSFEYSDVIAVQRKDISFSFLDVFPVPAENHVTAIIHTENETNAEVLLYNLQGQKIIHRFDKLVEGVNLIDLEWKTQGDPMYFLTVYNGKEWIVKKIVLIAD